jgi:hypothetical protein
MHRQTHSAVRLHVAEKSLLMSAPRCMCIRTEGGSMRPLFRDGELVAVIPAEPAVINIGDCVVYQWEDRILLHRVWQKKSSSVVITDDVGLTRLHLVPYEQVTYKVIGKGMLGTGIIGLCYSLFIRVLFSALRYVRKITYPAP